MLTEEDLRIVASWHGVESIASRFNFGIPEQKEALNFLLTIYGTFISLSDVTDIAQNIQTPIQLQALYTLADYDMNMAVNIQTPHQLEALKLILQYNDEQAHHSISFTCQYQVIALSLLLQSVAILERCSFNEIIEFALAFNSEDMLNRLMHLSNIVYLTYNHITDIINISSLQADEEDLYEEDPSYLEQKEEDYLWHVGQMPPRHIAYL